MDPYAVFVKICRDNIFHTVALFAATVLEIMECKSRTRKIPQLQAYRSKYCRMLQDLLPSTAPDEAINFIKAQE